MRSSASATAYEKSSKEKPRYQVGNRMTREVWVEMSGVLGLATDWFRSNVRVILQYSVRSKHKESVVNRCNFSCKFCRNGIARQVAVRLQLVTRHIGNLFCNFFGPAMIAQGRAHFYFLKRFQRYLKPLQSCNSKLQRVARLSQLVIMNFFYQRFETSCKENCIE